MVFGGGGCSCGERGGAGDIGDDERMEDLKGDAFVNLQKLFRCVKHSVRRLCRAGWHGGIGDDHQTSPLSPPLSLAGAPFGGVAPGPTSAATCHMFRSAWAVPEGLSL